MGQVFIPSSGGITVIPTDRESGPGAGGGASGNRDIFLGALAGFNSTTSDMIAVGNNVLSAGLTDATLSGTTVIGSQSLKSLTNSTPPGIRQGPLTVLGFNVFPSAPFRMGELTAVGANIGAAWPSVNPVDTSGMTLIGNNVLRYHNIRSTDYGAIDGCTIIGADAAAGQSGWTVGVGSGCSFNKSTIIGVQACEQSGTNGPTPACVLATSVVIGYQAGRGIVSNVSRTVADCVVIGAQSIIGTSPGSGCILVGAQMSITDTSPNNVVIGSNITANFSATGLNTIVGTGASIGVGIGARNVVLGAGAGAAIPGNGSDYFNVETFDGSTTRAILFGRMSSGNLVSGNSSTGQRDLETIACTNALKLVNGTRGTGNPSTGGFFYVSAGALHYVGSAGTDTTIAPA